MHRSTALLVGPIAGPDLPTIRDNCLRVGLDLGRIAWDLGYQPKCIHGWAFAAIRRAGGIETPELRTEGLQRSWDLVDRVAREPGSVLFSILNDDGLGWSSGTTADVHRWRRHHGPHRQRHLTWAEWMGLPR